MLLGYALLLQHLHKHKTYKAPKAPQLVHRFNTTTLGGKAEVIGPNIGGGEAGIITPFATTSTESLTITPILPNSGAAEFSATVENLSVEGGDLQASGKFTEIPEGSNIVINPSNTTGIPSITIDSTASGSDSTIGASILGTSC